MKARGQTLVLAALTLLFLAFMVVITLSIAWRVRDRIEAQVAADAAAYSEAVDVARTYNEVALMNRVQISMLVSTAAMHSLISWSSHHYSNLVATQKAMAEINAQYVAACCPLFCPCPCSQIGPSAMSLAAISAERAQVASQWDDLERGATDQVRQTWDGALQASVQAQKMWLALLDKRVAKQALAKTIAGAVYPDGQVDELEAPDQGDQKSGQELGDSIYDGDADKKVVQSAMLMMGTRGYDFVTYRRGRHAPIHDRLEPLVKVGNGAASLDVAADEGANAGGTTLGVDRHDNTVAKVKPGPLAWADDHGGTLNISWPAGSCSKSNSQTVRDTLLGAGPRRTQHTFSPGDSEPASRRHRLSSATGNGKIMPDFYAFNWPEIAKPKNDFGQPKLYTILDRDYRRAAKKPWDLKLTFHFTQAGSDVDTNGPDSSFKSPAGADLQHQVALSASIAYYHRPDAWKEPPNFFNPFWRATLYAADDDVDQYLTKAGFNQHGQTLKKLIRGGWVGTR